VAIDASVSLGKVDRGANFCTGVVLAVSLPGRSGEEKRVLVEAAHQMCSHSRALKDNVGVRFEVI
jgi:organic hydroperoxide reductase OsmC/OhrA